MSQYRTERDSRGIDHLVDERNRCATFANCTDHMSVEERARAELANGELAAEMGWPVSWSEVNRLHRVIEDLLAERLTIQAEAWDAAIEAVQSRMGEDGLLDQHRLIRLENPYRQKEES